LFGGWNLNSRIESLAVTLHGLKLEDKNLPIPGRGQSGWKYRTNTHL
jgi:hypothetical protein